MPASNRTAEHPIDEQFTQRWSPRAFTDETIDKATLLSFFEAARWAPSAYNAQPWRFLYALRGTPEFDRYLSLLVEFNQGWAKHAAALVVIVSKSTFAAPGTTEEKPAPTHAFDTGAAWGHLALQAHQRSVADAIGDSWVLQCHGVFAIQTAALLRHAKITAVFWKRSIKPIARHSI